MYDPFSLLLSHCTVHIHLLSTCLGQGRLKILIITSSSSSFPPPPSSLQSLAPQSHSSSSSSKSSISTAHEWIKTFGLAREKEAWQCASPYKASKHRDQVQEQRCDTTSMVMLKTDNWRNISKGGFTHL